LEDFNLKKLIIFLLSFSVCLSILSTCPVNASTSSKIDKFIAYLKKNGVTVKSKQPRAYQMINAIDGCAVNIGNIQLEIFEYKTKNANTKERNSYNQMKKGITIIKGYPKLKTIVNGPLILVPDSKKEDQSLATNIYKLFKKFKA
jgi:hypothetical protein